MQTIDVRADAEKVGIEVVGPRTPMMDHVVAVLRDAEGKSASHHLIRKRGAGRLRGEGVTMRRAGYVAEAAESAQGGRSAVYLVNCLRGDGTSSPAQVKRMVGGIRRRVPGASIITLIDETDPAAMRAAREAGATDFLSAREAGNEEAVLWRMLTARGASPRVSDAASPTEAAAARVAVDAAVAGLPSVAERQERAAAEVRVDAPALRDPESGRFDARRIAAALGISIARLARGVGISQQALSAKPDSPKAQAGLLPVARVLAALDELLPPEQQRMWLNVPRADFGGMTPLAWIEQGNGAAVARAVEAALEGDPG